MDKEDLGESIGWKVFVKPTDGYISRYINRRVSGRITLFIVRKGIGVTPNQVSLISFIIGVIAGISYLLFNPLLAGILVQVSSIIDGVDGELARILKKTSRFGGFLDAVLDRVVDIFVVSAYTLYLLNNGFNELFIYISWVLALTGSLMVSYLHARGEASLGRNPVLLGRLKCFISRDVRLFILFVASAIGYFYIQLMLACLWLLGILAYTYVIAKTIELSILYRGGGLR